jgi:hypothetical protein
VTPKEYEKAAGLCKGVLRHAWYPTTTDRVPTFGVYIANICERCGHERVMITNSQGRKLTPWRYIPYDKAAYKAIQADSMDEWRERYLKLAGITIKRRKAS